MLTAAVMDEFSKQASAADLIGKGATKAMKFVQKHPKTVLGGAGALLALNYVSNKLDEHHGTWHFLANSRQRNLQKKQLKQLENISLNLQKKNEKLQPLVVSDILGG